jgi:hypothetical protein
MQRVKGFILTLLVSTLAVGALPPASAAPPMPVNSTYLVKLGPRTVEPMPNTDLQIINEMNQATAAGTFATAPDGISFQVRAILRPATGEGIFSSVAMFNGSVAGVAGTALLGFVGTTTNFTTYQGDWVVLSGTGGLTNLRGQGTFLQSGANGTLLGLISFQ